MMHFYDNISEKSKKEFTNLAAGVTEDNFLLALFMRGFRCGQDELWEKFKIEKQVIQKLLESDEKGTDEASSTVD